MILTSCFLGCPAGFGWVGSGLDKERRQALRMLCRALGVRFRDLNLLNQALTHRSYVHEKDLHRGQSNERMEFLGDSVLGLLVNEHLYSRYAGRQEGRLTKIKSLVVSEAVLSKRAEDLSIGEYVLLSENERLSGGASRSSIIADALEAIIGAVYLDSGLAGARKFVDKHLLSGLDELLGVEEYRNYKSIIQEHAQKTQGIRPKYRIVSSKGPEHEQIFFVELRFGDRPLGRGEGRSKKEAEQMAARDALERLGLLGETETARGKRPSEANDSEQERPSRKERQA
jgi:ribonuclease-3